METTENWYVKSPCFFVCFWINRIQKNLKKASCSKLFARATQKLGAWRKPTLKSNEACLQFFFQWSSNCNRELIYSTIYFHFVRFVQNSDSNWQRSRQLVSEILWRHCRAANPSAPYRFWQRKKLLFRERFD